MPILNWPLGYQRGWLSTDLIAAVTFLTLLGLDQKGVHIVGEIVKLILRFFGVGSEED